MVSLFLLLASVVQRLDNAIHRINRYPADSVVCFVKTYPLDSDLSGGCWIVIYPVDSVIQFSNNRGLGCHLSYIVDLFAALHELASANARTLLKLASSVRALLKPYGDTLNRARA